MIRTEHRSSRATLRSFAPALAVIAPLACSGAASPAKTSAAPALAALAPAAPSRPEDADWARVVLAPASLSLELPEANAWQPTSDARRDWLALEHAPSESRVELRAFRAARLVKPAECRARAALERPELARFERADVVDRRSFSARAGTVTELVAIVTPVESGLVGELLAAQSELGRCALLRFATRAAGSDAERELARRLALVSERVVPSLRFTRVEDRVTIEPHR